MHRQRSASSGLSQSSEQYQKDRSFQTSEAWITLSFFVLLTLLSTLLMIWNSSTELSWDEADYASSVHYSWKYLWSASDYARHAHGPLAIYLAKLGRVVLPAVLRSSESQLRLPLAVFGSLAVGIAYWALRHTFGTTRYGALVGASLLLFSVIRLQETNVIGPHHLMLSLVLLAVALAYRWRSVLTIHAAVVLGIVFGIAAITMTYAIPLALCCSLSIIVAGGYWIQLDRSHLKFAWPLFVVIAAAMGTATVLWPPSFLQQRIIHDFMFYVHYPNHPTLVGSQIVERTPRTAALYWLSHLDAPILISSAVIIPAFIRHRITERSFAPGDRYLACSVMVLLGVALSAHMAGSRNLLQFLGAFSLMLGAFFDDAFKHRPRMMKLGASAIVFASALNLTVLSLDSHRVPYLATDGYRAFVEQNRELLGQDVSVMVYGSPILKFYAEDQHARMSWQVTEIPWTTNADVALPPSAQYALVSELVYRYMPTDQPVRRIVCSQWNLVWSFKSHRSWGLRLYKRP